ncbi:hypothetical protein J3L16_00415 [Alteromonas sp. 5E99-2]|nr:hypothetical protein [Alteromonas sp. 5E99-2]
MIELLVVLVLLGLITGAVVPSLESTLSSRRFAIQRKELAEQLALLPLKAQLTNQKVVVDSASALSVDAELQITRPIVVLANGFCLGGQLSIVQGAQQYEYQVNAPLCSVSPLLPN